METDGSKSVLTPEFQVTEEALLKEFTETIHDVSREVAEHAVTPALDKMHQQHPLQSAFDRAKCAK